MKKLNPIDLKEKRNELIGNLKIESSKTPFLLGALSKKTLDLVYRPEMGEGLSESVQVEVIQKRIDSHDQFWAESEVNLWELAGELEEGKFVGKNALDKYMHPLQPDIDVLYGPILEDSKSAPLVGIEVKYYSETTGLGKVIPRVRGLPFECPKCGWREEKPESAGGYYSGLDEAYALLTMGLDYVYLWHFVEFLPETWRPYWEEYGDDFMDKLVEEHAEFTKAYGGILIGMLKASGSPLGYSQHGLILGPEPRLTPIRFQLARPNPFRDSEIPRRVRDLILKGLGLEEY